MAAVVVLLGVLGEASADPDVKAGPQPVPPVKAQDPSLTTLDDHRRNVRGCAVGENCLRPAEVLREFEMEHMPPPGGSPWVNERMPPGSRLEAKPVRYAKKPSELRPDAPWLDSLTLPDLPVRWTKQLVDYLVFYRDDKRGRAIMESWLVDQGRYRDLIVSHLRKNKLPEDLLYVAMIESSYDPNTLSSAGALGVWQWMPEGAKIYGLRRDHWVDERKDPLRSTIAQMDYFKDLYQRFGDWHIALASFNVGYGAMLRSIARYNTNDIYQLCEYENAIPWETCWYTPKVLATAIVGRNRAAFGFDKAKVKPGEVYEDFAVPTSLTLGLIAQAANVPVAEIAKLNPHLRHGRTPPGEAGYIVRIPPGTRLETQRRLAELQSQWDGFDAYVVSHGERFEDVAMIHGIDVWRLRKLNDMTHDSEIQGGSVLVVPRITHEQREKGKAKARAALHSSGVDQKPGELLIVPVPDKDATMPGKKRVFYRVVVGDTLTGVAKAFGLPKADLAKWNELDDEGKLHPRMVLLAWVAPSFDASARRLTLLDESQLAVVTRGSAEHLDLQEGRLGRVRTEYVATGREKVADIAKRFGLGSHDLARINRISYDATLQKGDKLIVYQVADARRSERAMKQFNLTPRGMRGRVVGPKAATTASLARDDGDETDEEQVAGNKGEDEPAPPPTRMRAGFFPVPRS